MNIRISMAQYVELYFDGNKAAFGRAFGRTPQSVNKLFKTPDQWMILMGDDIHILAQIRATRTV